MSDMPSQATGRSILPRWVRCPQDFVGGIALMGVAVFALWTSWDLQGMRGFSFGAGTAPHMFAGLLFAFGLAVMMIGVFNEGPAVARLYWRGPFFVMLAIIFFAVTIRPLGLVLSAFASFMVAALGTPETRWLEAVIVGVLLTVGCSLLFPYALGLPFQLSPSFMIQ